MKRKRIEPRARRDRDERAPILPLEARDPDILRAKRLAEDLRRKRS